MADDLISQVLGGCRCLLVFFTFHSDANNANTVFVSKLTMTKLLTRFVAHKVGKAAYSVCVTLTEHSAETHRLEVSSPRRFVRIIDSQSLGKEENRMLAPV